jgi:hypothetical protein
MPRNSDGRSRISIGTMLTKQGKEIDDLTETVALVVKHMTTKEDLSALRYDLKSDIVAVHTQVNSIERHLREMKYPKLEDRVADLEEKVFGDIRA